MNRQSTTLEDSCNIVFDEEEEFKVEICNTQLDPSVAHAAKEIYKPVQLVPESSSGLTASTEENNDVKDSSLDGRDKQRPNELMSSFGVPRVDIDELLSGPISDIRL